MGIRAVGFCFVALLISCTQTVQAQVKSVVAIFGGESRTPAYQPFDPVFRDMLGPGSADRLQFYQEFLDNARFPDPGHERQLADYLRDRYSGKQIDLVLAVDPNALQFLAKFRSEMFPGAPVVFVGVRTSTVARLDLPPDFIGVPIDLDPAPTIRMALALQPGARELVVVTGTAAMDLDWERAIRATPLPPGVKLRSLNGMSIEAIEREVAALDPGAIVLMASFRRDGAGRTFPGGQVPLARVSAASKAPIFHVYDVAVGIGAVASFSTPLQAMVVQAAGIGKRVLDGEPAGSIVLPESLAPVPVADWRELQRWGMDESRLPPGTVVRFRDPTFWDQYRYHVLAVAALVILETALVAGLLLQRRKRRRIQAQLRQSEQTMQLAANAAQLVMWKWDIARDEIWMSEGNPVLASLMPPGPRSLGKFLGAIHEEDRDAVQRAIRRAIREDGIYESEYRAVGADGITRWFAGRGRVEYVNDAPRQLRGITLDITRRKEAELDAQHQRNELAHLSRVTMLGELSGSVAHELNQPLMAILSNAQAARMFLAQETVDLVELGQILDDIVEDDKRAGEIIWGLRKMLKKEEVAHEPLAVNELVQDVLRMMRSDLMNRGVAVEVGLAADGTAIRGDRMQLQQVLLNLILNACDSMASNPKGERILVLRTDSLDGHVAVSVCDRGEGIPPKSLEGIFTPFFTTKKQGLGLGLSVCSSIIASHGGELRAANNTDRGATFTFILHAHAHAQAQAQAQVEAEALA